MSSTTRTITSSPSPEWGASTTETPETGSTARAAPSTTSTTSTGPGNPGRPSAATEPSESRNRRTAPARSRHHPSGTDPITFAASTTRTGRRSGPGDAAGIGPVYERVGGAGGSSANAVSSLYGGQQRDADSDRGRTSGLPGGQPLTEQKVRGHCRDRGELRGQHRADRDAGGGTDRERHEAGDLGQSDGDHQRRRCSGQPEPGQQSERYGYREHSDQPGRQDGPGCRQGCAHLAGRVQGEPEGDRGPDRVASGDRLVPDPGPILYYLRRSGRGHHRDSRDDHAEHDSGGNA